MPAKVSKLFTISSQVAEQVRARLDEQHAAELAAHAAPVTAAEERRYRAALDTAPAGTVVPLRGPRPVRKSMSALVERLLAEWLLAEWTASKPAKRTKKGGAL